jgi:phosphohistidine phosphatase
MNLYILRHAIAVEHGAPGITNDDDRPLTDKGIRKLKKVIKAIAAMDLEFDVILSSPLIRAKQTAEITADELKLRKNLKFTNDLKPGGNPRTLIQHINELSSKPGNIVLVGHEPYLSKLIALLSSGNTDTRIDLKKAGLCKMEIETLQYARCATLCWLLTPGQMELMA